MWMSIVFSELRRIPFSFAACEFPVLLVVGMFYLKEHGLKNHKLRDIREPARGQEGSTAQMLCHFFMAEQNNQKNIRDF